jgi:beta-glucuronidase
MVLDKVEDDLYTRFGIREFTSKGPEIYLNGERFKLMGANHHDDHPDWGSALPPHIIRQDIEIYKRMRANAARGHYPPSEMFMDFCDQYGLVFMNEVPSWQYRPEQMANPVVKEKIKKQYFDMVYRDMNHPSIISWSLGNEWREFEKSYNDIKELVDYARTIDQSHFITFIAGGAHVDKSYGLIDIICTNWAKYQWYWNPTYKPDSSDDRPKSTRLNEDVGKESIRRLNNIHEIYPNKPVILTEFGGSGSQAGWHNWGNVKWSEEYQARNVWDSGLYGLETDWISGGCVWQFCDSRTTQLRMLGPRLRGWNVKGVVDGYRQPKMAFYKLQELFSRFNSLIVPSK